MVFDFGGRRSKCKGAAEQTAKKLETAISSPIFKIEGSTKSPKVGD